MIRAILFILLVVVISCKSNEHTFNKRDIKGAQRLAGLNFENDKIRLMHRYLLRNYAGYDSMRHYGIPYDISPAMVFDPRPSGFEFPEKGTPTAWSAIPTDRPEILNKLAFYSIPQLAYLLQNRLVSSEELTGMYINRIKKYNEQLEAIITITEDLALEQARRADKEIAEGNYRGLLHGIPYGVKDLMAVEGYPTTWGAEPYREQQIDMTASVVKQLEEAGAVLIAKLTSGSLARGDVWFGGTTKNPWDLEQGASGSSAGSGSATSAGLVAFSLGTETLGSITSPSNRCGITGLRPTYGRVSRKGVMTLSWSMDKVGPMARSAQDCAIVFSHILGSYNDDPTIFESPFNYTLDRDIQTLKIAYLAEDFRKDTTSVGKRRLEALNKFADLGIEMDSVSLPEGIPYNSFDIILRAESGAFFDLLIRSGEVDDLVQQHPGSRANSLRQSRFIPAVEYLQANRHRRVLMEKMNELMKDYDVLIAPTFGSRQLQITNLTGHPALAIPTGLDDEGHPTSITLIGNLFDEGSILELGEAFQEATEFDEARPPLFDVH